MVLCPALEQESYVLRVVTKRLKEMWWENVEKNKSRYFGEMFENITFVILSSENHSAAFCFSLFR